MTHRWKLGRRLLLVVLCAELLSLAGAATVLPRWVSIDAIRAWLVSRPPEPPPAPSETPNPSSPDGAPGASNVAPPAAEKRPEPRVQAIAVRRGDTLLRALAREGVEHRVGLSIADALRGSGANLRRIRPSHTLEVTWSLDGEPIAVHYVPSPWLGYVAMATDGGWEVRRAETRPDVRVEVVAGEVRRSLFEAVEASGAMPQLAFDLAEIFASEFDFTADTRAGDRFRLLVEKRYAGDTFVDYGQILVAQYVSDGQALTGIGFERSGAWRFYDRDGRSLKKSFLKSPLEFTRITSGFTYARPHPILGGTRPHLAIDYAAPPGTPVRAVADGRVIAAGWNGGNGISVRLKHRAGYETMYNHLSRLAPGVRRGARVTQRQVIGYVGSTGLSTGPHLDYRVAKGGRFVNPLSEKFLPGEPIPASERAEFLAHARDLARRLEDEAPF
ncbi:MAG: M23 family metallopeptidase [Candidatus Rokubacteria bacterium]|nr:M23 family metallopeptidase [Candidatus Rokubacteria bacterium]